MPKIRRLSDEDRALGQALAERAGLDPSVTLQDYNVQTIGEEVLVRFEVIHKMPKEEFAALVAHFNAGK